MREQFLKAFRFERPDYIPMVFAVNPACWHHYDQSELQDLMEHHTFLFPTFKRKESVIPRYALHQKKDDPYTDSWGCVWETSDNGITGAVVKHPLDDWNNFSEYTPPNPDQTDGMFAINWSEQKQKVQKMKNNGRLAVRGLPHGHSYLRLQDIRGYQQLTFDMVDEEPKLMELIAMIEEFNLQVTKHCLQLEPDIMKYPEDLGMQIGPMLSPDHFRKYIKPMYQKIMKPARDQGILIHKHCDGDIRTLVDDILDCGVNILNPQDLVNGVDWIAENLKGRVCIDLDIDRQHITVQGTPKEIDALIKEEVVKLGSKEGGLTMIYGLYPEVPIENVAAVMIAMEKYATYYS